MAKSPHFPSNNARLPSLPVELDQAVAAAYGWSDLAGSSGSQLGYVFHATKQGERNAFREPAGRTVLDSLLALNHQPYDEEVKEGLHDKGTRKAKVARKTRSAAATAAPDESRPAHQPDFFL